MALRNYSPTGHSEQILLGEQMADNLPDPQHVLYIVFHI